LISDLKGFTYKAGCQDIKSFLPRVGDVQGQISKKEFSTNLTESDNFFNPRFQAYAGRNPKIKFLTGKNTNRSIEIDSFTAASKTIKTKQDFEFNPEEGDRFIIEGSHINRRTDRSNEIFKLKANKTYNFNLNFSTNDHLFHLDSFYYQIDLTFTKST